tara:strand:- start:16706 stop:17095 length:390 start_codon:yes stop_codon:yes gene_type:complete
MVVTSDNIRDLLNRPKGLNEATIAEYLTIRTEEITKLSRSTSLYGVGETSGVSDTQKESAIKFLVCVDCLRIMIDTIPSYVPEPEQRRTDIRLSAQLKSFEAQADRLFAQVSEAAGSAFALDFTNTRVE